jgi:hypothetical protein
METENSVLEFYSGLMIEMHNDIAELANIRDRTLMYERQVIVNRIKEEGISFLTKTLPCLGKAVDTALATGTELNVTGFKLRRNSKLPRFLGHLLSFIFDDYGFARPESWYPEKGPIIAGFEAEALRYFRQFVFAVYKLKIPYEPESVEETLSKFVQTDEELNRVYAPDNDPVHGCFDGHVTPNERRVLDWAARECSSIFGLFNEMDIVPSHGPGAVATGEQVEEKSKFSRLYKTIETKYPFTEYFVFNLSHVTDCYKDFNSLEEISEPTAKVVVVPKDSRGGRLISCEPLEVQFVQQGLGKKMMTHLESHRKTKGFVNFTDQNVNRLLALQGSAGYRGFYHHRLDKTIDGCSEAWATLDMKDASDRVSLNLVKEIFKLTPGLLGALIATRSTRTMLPDGRTITLKKFAPMGSCLCFPVEAFVFWVLCVGILVVHGGLSPKKARKSVYVYGDDIIVARQHCHWLLRFLESFELKFNLSKCCTEGFFRESCGCDAYQGIDVTPARMSTVWSSRRQYGPEVLYSYATFSNVMYDRGYVRVANYIRQHLVSIYGEIPYTDSITRASEIGSSLDDPRIMTAAGGVVFYANDIPISILNKRVKRRWNASLHRLEYMSYSVKPGKVNARYDGYEEMLRNLKGSGRDTKGRYAVRHRSRLQRRWIGLA